MSNYSQTDILNKVNKALEKAKTTVSLEAVENFLKNMLCCREKSFNEQQASSTIAYFVKIHNSDSKEEVSEKIEDNAISLRRYCSEIYEDFIVTDEKARSIIFPIFSSVISFYEEELNPIEHRNKVVCLARTKLGRRGRKSNKELKELEENKQKLSFKINKNGEKVINLPFFLEKINARNSLVFKKQNPEQDILKIIDFHKLKKDELQNNGYFIKI